MYDNAAEIDLGGRVVKLDYYGPAHTLGDQVARRCTAGSDLASLQQALTPILRAQHPDWDLKDWSGMEIQAYYQRLCRLGMEGGYRVGSGQ